MRPKNRKAVNENADGMISLKTLSIKLDAHRTSVRRWMREAGVKPVAVGKGRRGAIRYPWPEVKAWLETLDRVA